MMVADAPLLQMRVVGVIKRRELLQRDPPVDFGLALAEIRRLGGFGTSELAFVLNIARTTLSSWESRGSKPGFEDGRAILKLLTQLRHTDE
jgi:DNA-binding transcriptional regulator YiaG